MISNHRKDYLITMLVDWATFNRYHLEFATSSSDMCRFEIDYTRQYVIKWDEVDNIYEAFEDIVKHHENIRENRGYVAIYSRGQGKSAAHLEAIKRSINSVYGVASMEENSINRRGIAIKNVIFNDPATIVFWSDDTKTVVKCCKDDIYDPGKGLAMAVAKKFLGTNKSGSNYYDALKPWIDGYYEEQAAIIECMNKLHGTFQKASEGLSSLAMSLCGLREGIKDKRTTTRSCAFCKYAVYLSGDKPCNTCWDIPNHPNFEAVKQE